MNIKYYATLQDITGKKEETWTIHEDTLGDLIRSLGNKYGKAFNKWVSSENGGHGSLSIFLVNGQDYRSLNGLQTQLKDSDIIAIFPPIAGG